MHQKPINTGWIEVICGPMFSGKTEELIRRLIRAQIAKQKVKALICLGKDNSKIKNAFKKFVKVIHDCKSMEEAVKISFKLSSFGDAVLLSPACSSFDLYNNYEERRNDFKKEVKIT